MSVGFGGDVQIAGAVRSSWLEISEAALEQNLAVLRQLVGAGCQLGAVVKADAYGHGLLQILPVIHSRVEVLYVIAPGDALSIRRWERSAGVTPRQTLVLGAVAADEVVDLAAHGVAVVLSDTGWRTWVEPLRQAGVRLSVHVHVDSGLGREGFVAGELARALDGIAAIEVIDVVGVMTHFADTEDVTEQAYAVEQLRRFDEGQAILSAMLGGRSLQRHAAASAATLVLPDSRLDVVRVGIALYGLWPSRETRISTRLVHGHLPRLDPVLAWRVFSQHVKRLPAGSFIGYGCTFRCSEDTRVAVLPVGYYDGYPRSLSARAHVLVQGVRCAVLGRVMMNHIVIDLSRLPGCPEQVQVTLIGRDGQEEVTADDLAGWAGTINYEIVARLPSHLRRRLVR